jgi:hypothetical protein
MNTYVTWRELIQREMRKNDDSFDNVEFSISREENWLEIQFDSSYGYEEGVPFTLWTKSRVYFPVCYDGSEWCGSVPRNPCEQILGHIGR